EQVGDAVQRDGGLAGAGGALDAQRGLQRGADQVVLLGLDGGDDVAHRAGARSLDLGGQQPVAGLGGRFGGGEVLVLEGGELPAGAEAVPAAGEHAHRVARPGPVEGGRDGRAPVQHQRGAGGVVHVAAADVAQVGGVRPVPVPQPALPV